MKFKITALALVLVLALSAAGLAVAGILAPPQLRQTSVHTARVTELPEQRLVLTANQPLAAAKEAKVTITPQAEFTAQTTTNQVVITFAQPLLAGVEYTVAAEVTGAATGATGQLTTTFTTDKLKLTTLSATSGRVASTVITGKQQLLLEESGISEYAIAGDWVAAIRPLHADESRLTVQRADGSDRIDLIQFPTDAPRRLQFSSDGTLLGNLMRSADADKQTAGVAAGQDLLMVHALATISPATGRFITDAAGEYVPVKDWFFEAGSSTIRLLKPDGSTMLVPLGGVAEPDPRPWPQTLRDHSRVQLANGSVYALRGNQLITATGDGADEHTVFKPAAASSQLRAVCASPNDQYLAVEVLAADGTAQQAIIETSSGQQITAVVGSAASWCARTP